MRIATYSVRTVINFIYRIFTHRLPIVKLSLKFDLIEMKKLLCIIDFFGITKRQIPNK